MRRTLALVLALTAVGVTGCGTGSSSESNPGRTSITAPATKARGVVDQQNAQLKQMEQQTGSADPTAAP